MPVTLKTRVCCFLTLEPSICPLRVGAENIQLSALPAIRLLVIAVTRGVIGIRRRAALVLPTNAINSVSLTIISRSSTPIDDSETVIAVAPAVKSINETIVSVKEIIIGERLIIISGPATLIFIPETIIGGTPAIVSGSQIFISVTQILISGRTLDSRNQPVADMPREISISITLILISVTEMIIKKPV